MHFLECDDGNTRSGDGCSSTCTVEKDYRCSGGTEDRPDTCIETRKPEIRSATVYKNLTAVLRFNEPVSLVGAKPQDTLQLTVAGHIRGNIRLQWEAQKFERRSFNKLLLDLNVNVSLTGYEVYRIVQHRLWKLRW